jgi:hypothetical protein
MAEGWLSRKEALAYFGLGDDVEELERLCVEHDVDVDVNDAGDIMRVDAAEAKAVLFTEHKRKVGYRPDDERVQKVLQRRERANAAARKRRRRERRKRLEERVAKRIP